MNWTQDIPVSEVVTGLLVVATGVALAVYSLRLNVQKIDAPEPQRVNNPGFSRAMRLLLSLIVISVVYSLFEAQLNHRSALEAHVAMASVVTERDELISERDAARNEVVVARAAEETAVQELSNCTTNLEQREGGCQSALLRIKVALRDLIDVSTGADQLVLSMNDSKVHFESSRSALVTGDPKTAARNHEVLGRIVGALLAAGPADYTIRIRGHADYTGGDVVNDPLSQERADAVKQYLIGKGISDNTIVESKGFGSRRPIDRDRTTAARKKNRRVELVLTKKEK